MSWWVYLNDENGSPVDVEPFIEGGTYQQGGCIRGVLNVTYNYSKLFRMAGLNLALSLHGKIAKDTMPLLQKAVDTLGTDQYKDYWAPTPGNAGYALSILLGWAKQHPEGVWEVH